jgi:hypothetical protein
MLDSISAQDLIKENMPVVCSQNGELAVVDHLEGADTIKLAKDANGEHHYIPLAWVSSVDDKVHLDRTGEEVMKAWSSTPEVSSEAPGVAPAHHVNSVDATMGQPIIARVTARKTELEGLLAALAPDQTRTRGDIELALSTIESLLTGDLEHIPAVVVSDMSQWLEHNKHLAESAAEPVAEREPDPTKN